MLRTSPVDGLKQIVPCQCVVAAGTFGGSTVIRVSVALPIEKAKEHNAKIQVERARLATDQRVFEQNKASRLIIANSPEGAKLRAERKAQRRAKHIAQHERAKLRAERKARRRSRKPSPPTISASSPRAERLA